MKLEFLLTCIFLIMFAGKILAIGAAASIPWVWVFCPIWGYAAVAVVLLILTDRY